MLSKQMLNFEEFIRRTIDYNSGLKTDLRVILIDKLKEIVCSLPDVTDIHINALNDLFYGGNRIRNYGIDTKGDMKLNSLLKVLYYNDVLTKEKLESELNLNKVNLNSFLRMQNQIREGIIEIIFENNLYYGRQDLDIPRGTEFYKPEFELYLELWLSFSIESGKPLPNNAFFEKIGMMPSFAISSVLGILQWKYFSLLFGKFDKSDGTILPGVIHLKLSFQNQLRASEALVKYGIVRDIWTKSPPSSRGGQVVPVIRSSRHIDNLLDSRIQGFKDLKTYLFKIRHSRGVFPKEIKGFDNYYRVSKLNKMSSNLDKKIRKGFVDLIKPKLISYEYNKDPSPKFIEDILEYSQKDKYKKFQLTGSGGNPDHKYLLPMIVKNVEGALGSEINVWLSRNDNCITGHIDLLVVQGDTIYVCDYKPDLMFKDATIGKDFSNAVPQVLAYALLLKEALGLSKVKGLIFNLQGAVEFDLQIANQIISYISRHRPSNLITWSLFF